MGNRAIMAYNFTVKGLARFEFIELRKQCSAIEQQSNSYIKPHLKGLVAN